MKNPFRHYRQVDTVSVNAPKLLMKRRCSDIEESIMNKIKRLIDIAPMSQIGDVLALNVKLNEAKGDPYRLAKLEKEVNDFLLK